MTIKNFARLCGCNPQTLRYYDRVDLLKPAKVDPWSGYRYYEEEQALVFVKIKNLQSADFTIDEIRALLDADQSVIYEAFNEKIARQEDKLNTIKRIQQSYQSEMSNMEKRINEVQELVTRAMLAYDPTEEFGIGQEEYARIVDNVNQAFTGWRPDGMDIDFTDYVESDADPAEETLFLDVLHSPEYEVIYEKHGWVHMKDFLQEFADLKDGGEYALCLELRKGKADGSAFCNTILGILLGQNPGKKISLSCNIGFSRDGENHFRLLRRK